MEWAYIPEVCVMTHGAMQLTLRVIRGLIVYPDNMARNLDVTRRFAAGGTGHAGAGQIHRTAARSRHHL